MRVEARPNQRLFLAVILVSILVPALLRPQMTIDKASARLHELRSQVAGITKGEFEKTVDFEKRREGTQQRVQTAINELVKKDYLGNLRIGNAHYDADKETLFLGIEVLYYIKMQKGGTVPNPLASIPTRMVLSPKEAQNVTKNIKNGKASAKLWLEEDGSIHLLGPVTLKLGSRKYTTEPGADCVRILKSVRIEDAARGVKWWGLRLSPDNKFLLGFENQGMTFWNAATGTEERKIETGQTYGLSFSPNGESLAAMIYDSNNRTYRLVLFDAASYSPTFETVLSNFRYSGGLIFSKDGRYLTLETNDGKGNNYDVIERRQIDARPDEDNSVQPHDVAQGGRWTVRYTGGIFNIPTDLEIVDIENGDKVLRSMKSKHGNLSKKTHTFSKDGTLFAYIDFTDIRIVELQEVRDNMGIQEIEGEVGKVVPTKPGLKHRLEVLSTGFSTKQVEMLLGQTIEITNKEQKLFRIVISIDGEEVVDIDLERRGSKYSFVPQKRGVYAIMEVQHGEFEGATIYVD